MTHPSYPARPPRGAQAILRCVLPCDSIRDAIFGDLHEEFVRDITRLGTKRARARHRRRAAGIVAHAVWDSLCWRVWATAVPASGSPRPYHDPTGVPPPGAVTRGRYGRAARARRVIRNLASAVLALGVLSTGIVVNTTVFSAVQATAHEPANPDAAFLALGLGSVVFLAACAGIAAAVLCLGPRWRRGRQRQPMRIG